MTEKKLEDMSVVELITLCQENGINYHKGNEILDADSLIAKIAKITKRPRAN